MGSEAPALRTTESSKNATRNYELDRTLQHTRQPAGRIKRVSVAVLVDNVPRVLPEGVDARFDLSSWTVPALFQVLQRQGGVERDEMFRAFNMGVGMVVAVAAQDADAAVDALNAAGERAWICGEVVPGSRRTVLA